ncbi:MAG: DUF1428 domain-containing protein [Oceanicaulis sp.]
MAYIDGVLLPVPATRKEDYRAHALKAAEVFKRHGALKIVECWGDDLPEGKLNSMHTAVMREGEETVVFNWIMWPSKEARDAAWPEIMEDPEMDGMEMPFDGKRMIYGGFEVLFEV